MLSTIAAPSTTLDCELFEVLVRNSNFLIGTLDAMKLEVGSCGEDVLASQVPHSQICKCDAEVSLDLRCTHDLPGQ